MSRSYWKPTFVSTYIQQKLDQNELFTHSRATKITEKRIGYTYTIYNGIRWYKLLITAERLNSSLGQYAPTCKRAMYKIKSKK